MLIEVTGPSCSGKTTIVRYVGRTFDKAIYITPSYRNKFLQFISDVRWGAFGIVVAAIWWREYSDWIKCTADYIEDCYRSFEKITLYRSLFRKLGLYVWMKRKSDRGAVCLLDEGPIHILHNLMLAFEGVSDDEFNAYISKIPKPDVLLVMIAKIDTLISRAAVRPDMTSSARNDRRRFLNSALKTYDLLINSTSISIETKVLVYDEDDHKNIVEFVSGYVS